MHLPKGVVGGWEQAIDANTSGRGAARRNYLHRWGTEVHKFVVLAGEAGGWVGGWEQSMHANTSGRGAAR